MNSTTYRELEAAGIIEGMKARGEIIVIDESIPNGQVVRTETIDIAEMKRRELRKVYPQKTRSGYTKVGMQARDKAKAKASRAARKRNRK
jgi:hypothetical protein